MGAIRKSRAKDIDGRRTTALAESRFSDPLPDLTVEEAERRLRSGSGLFATLTPEQIAFIEAYDGPENAGRFGPKRECS